MVGLVILDIRIGELPQLGHCQFSAPTTLVVLMKQKGLLQSISFPRLLQVAKPIFQFFACAAAVACLPDVQSRQGVGTPTVDLDAMTFA